MKREHNKEPNTLVVDPVKGWGLEYIEESEGNLFRYGDRSVYFMSRVKGELKPINRPANIDTQPEKLYRALMWPEVKELFKLDTSLMEKLQIGATIALVAVMLFFVFLILSGKGVI
jgi:hypothetical protein